MEVSTFQLWLMFIGISTLFLSGLCWCFCCGTCVGRSLLRNTGLVSFARDGNSRRHELDHRPDEEELWHLETWQEDSDSEEIH
ncbi:hypothetical protein K501DRAFT_202878 [Backusella circina FSU 941]|nr:hypothetical protein K501DRAFT_202878 [Backusella circina FSU 941]